MTYRLSAKGEEDLIQIYLAGVRDFGVAQAERYWDGLEETFSLIANFPQIARERSELSPPARIHPYRSHIVVYVLADGAPLILRVRHGREDWDPPRGG